MRYLYVVLLLVLVFFHFSCDTQKSEKNLQGSNSALSMLGTPDDYFPLHVGKEWKYRIEVQRTGDFDPIYFELIGWPSGNREISVLTRGRLITSDVGSDPMLIIRIDSTARKQGPFRYATGYKLSIVRDDLNIYGYEHYNWGVFWLKSPDKYRILEVRLHDPNGPGNLSSSMWGSWHAEPGYSINFIFFAEAPMTSISLGEESDDNLLFIGPDTYQGKQALHYQRRVERSERTSHNFNYFDNEFTEDRWYVKHVGLAYFEQKVNGVITMKWTLQK